MASPMPGSVAAAQRDLVRLLKSLARRHGLAVDVTQDADVATVERALRGAAALSERARSLF